MAYAAQTRLVLTNMDTLDKDVFHDAVKKTEQEPFKIMKAVATLAVMDQDHAARISSKHDSACPYCNNATGTMDHTIYMCQAVRIMDIRNTLGDDMEQLVVTLAQHLPKHILLKLLFL